MIDRGGEEDLSDGDEEQMISLTLKSYTNEQLVGLKSTEIFLMDPLASSEIAC
jgi:hypothetical protein